MADAVNGIRIGHSADPYDAFMVWALEAGKVDTRGLDLQPVVSDIQTLNEWALEGRLEVTALSGYATTFPQKPGLILGFAGVSPRELTRGIEVLARALE